MEELKTIQTRKGNSNEDNSSNASGGSSRTSRTSGSNTTPRNITPASSNTAITTIKPGNTTSNVANRVSRFHNTSPGSSKNSVIVRWLNEASDDDSEESISFQALLIMRKKSSERKRIEKLGLMVPLNSNFQTMTPVRPGQSLPAMRRVMGLPAEVHGGASSPTSSTSEQSAIPIRNKRSEISLPIATDDLIAELERESEKLNINSDEEQNKERKSSLSSPFKRKARKSISFGVVEIQTDEKVNEATEDEDAPDISTTSICPSILD